MPAEAAFARIDRPADRMESRGLEYLTAVREGSLKHVSNAGKHHVIVDANQPIEAIHLEIIARISDGTKMI